MEEREHLFNRTSKKIEKRVEQLYFDVYDLMLDKDLYDRDFAKKEVIEKEFLLLSNLINYNNNTLIDNNDTLINIIEEKAYEFCLKNKNNVMTYDDNGIVIKDKNSEEGDPVASVFIELYKYIEYVKHAYQITVTNFGKLNMNAQTVKSIFATCYSNDFEYLSPSQMDKIIEMFSKHVLEFDHQFEYDYELGYVTADTIKSKTAPQQFAFYVYLETICHVFNNIRRNPEIFKDKLGISLEDLYSDKFIYTAFTTRDIMISNFYDNIKDFSRTYHEYTQGLPFN